MKKFTKISLIVAAVMLGVGMLLGGIASMMGVGFSTLRHMARSGEFDKGNWHIRDTGIYYSNEAQDWEVNWGFDGEEGVEADDKAVTGNNAYYQEYDLTSVKNIDIDVDAASIYVKPSNDANKISVELERGKAKYYKCELDGDTLEIGYNTNNHHDYNHNGLDAPKLVICIPDNASFADWNVDLGAAEMIMEETTLACENLTVDVGAGRMEVESVAVLQQTEINIGAGEVVIEDGAFKNIVMDCAMGNIELDGVLEGDLNGNCAMGSIVIDLAGNETDYNYELSCSMGNLEVNGTGYSGIDGGYRENNAGAVGTITLECDMGNVELDVK